MNSWSVLEKINVSRGMGSSNQCYVVLYAIARAFNVKTVVEIGTHRGASAIALTQAILDNGYTPEVHTIDNYLMYTDHRFEGIKDEARCNLLEAGLLDHIIIYDGDSKDILPLIFEELVRVDACFIDGDHSDEGVMRDYRLCEPHTDLIIFHDTCNGNKSYFDAVRDDGFTILTFPTKYVEGDGHEVGISIAKRGI